VQNLDERLRQELDHLYPELDDIPEQWGRILRESEMSEPARPGRHRIWHRLASPVQRHPRRALAAVAVLVIVVTGAIVPASLLPDRRFGASDAAAQALSKVAAVAAKQPQIARGGYVYMKAQTLFALTNTGERPFTALRPAVRESWVAEDGSGRVREVRGELMFLSERDRERWRAEGSFSGETLTDDRFGPQGSWAADLRLPTDPTELQHAILARVADRDAPRDSSAFTEIADLLTSPASSPELRSALYQVLARWDGVELVGSTSDPLGRTGVAIAAPVGDDGTARTLLIFDPQTSAVLAWVLELDKRVDWIGIEPPAVISSVTYLDSGWVESDTETPDRAS